MEIFHKDEKCKKLLQDSMLRVTFYEDSLKIERQFAEMEKWEKPEASAIRPVYEAGLYSGVVPVQELTEVPVVCT